MLSLSFRAASAGLRKDPKPVAQALPVLFANLRPEDKLREAMENTAPVAFARQFSRRIFNFLFNRCSCRKPGWRGSLPRKTLYPSHHDSIARSRRPSAQEGAICELSGVPSLTSCFAAIPPGFSKTH